MSDMREEFEKWYLNHAKLRSGSNFSAESIIALRQGDSYAPDCKYLIALWEAWQAAQSAAVPEHIRSIKIPTDAMEQEFQKHYRRGYEAGKSDAVPVVGEPVAWRHIRKSNGEHELSYEAIDKHANLFDSTPLVIQPATSITAAELDALRKDAERYRWLSYNASYGIHEMLFGKPAFASLHKESDLADCIDEQLDAAIAGEKSHE